MATILVVDYRPANREFLAVLLGHAGHIAQEAQDGDEALGHARRGPPDLIISDILMPTMDGVELVRELRADPELRHIPVIFYTATFRHAEAQVLAASCGVSTVILKPSEPHALLDAIHREIGLPAFTPAGPLPVSRGRDLAAATDRLCRSSIEDVTALQRQIHAVMEGDDSPNGKVRQLHQISAALNQLTRAHAISMRLATLIELAIDLATQRVPKQLLEVFCRAAHSILNAKYAAVCILDENGRVQRHVVWGMSEQQTADVLATFEPTEGIFGALLDDKEPRRLHGVAASHVLLGLPSSHPIVDNFLGVGIRSESRGIGWFYVAGKLGGGRFQEEDEQVAIILASLLAREYENAELYDSLKRHVDALAAELDERQRALDQEEQLHDLAYYDSLTGLPNATLFQERLSQLIERLPGTKVALFMIELDRFSHLSELLGRSVGDELLRSVGQRLVGTLPEPGNLARISSDTFALAVSQVGEQTDPSLFVHDKIFAAFSRPFEAGGREVWIVARAGVAIYPADDGDSGTVFRNAEAALEEAKASGVRYLFHSPELNSRIAEDIALEQKLFAGTAHQEFMLHYQPKLDAKTKQVDGLEALLRWNSPEAARASPSRIIRALENSELILEVGQWVLTQALSDWKGWRDAGLQPPRVAVNVSAVQLRYPNFADIVLAALDRCGVPGEALELEITESVIMSDVESNVERLRKICDAGVTIAIDDFGTRYSSLRYLAKLKVHALKIDRSFISRMTMEAASMTLVSMIIGLGHALDLNVVAEGVEEEGQARLLGLLKCDTLQGFLFSKPLPAKQIEDVLRQRV